MDEIIGHKKLNSAVGKSNGLIKSKNGQLKPRITTKGWEFSVKWMDGLRSWLPMIDINESYPIQLAEYAKVHNIDDLVADGHLTPDPVGSTYAGVVSRETVRIALTYAALHGLDLWTADTMNAFVQAPTTEKYWIECGPEFGTEHVGKKAIVTRALYGMKSSS